MAPFHSLSLDHIGPLYPEINGFRYILACKCLFSNWVELLPCKTTSAQEVTTLLASEVFCRYSLPACIIADRGSAFTSQEMQDMCGFYGMLLKAVASNAPWKNGKTERHGGLLKEMILKMMADTIQFPSGLERQARLKLRAASDV